MQIAPSNHRLAERKLIVMVHESRWEIDDNGRIWCIAMRRGLKTGGSRVIPVTRRRAERKLPLGYLLVRAMLDGHVVTGLAHRLVWQHFRGDIPAGLVINHKNGRKDDNRIDNLETVTYSENSLHCHANLNPTVLRGSKNGGSKLTESDVIDMRIARANGASLNALAARFGISFQQVSTISKGHRWAHIKDAPLAIADGRLNCKQNRDNSTGKFISNRAEDHRG